MSTPATSEMESTEQLYGTRPWGALSARQKLFVETFIRSNGDAVLSTQTAYDCASERNAKVLSYEIAANPKIRAVLDLFYGRSQRDSFIEQLQKRIEDRSITVAEWRAASLLCRLKGWAAIPADDSEEMAAESENSENLKARHQIGDIVSQNNFTYRVTKVDADGHITDAEPVTDIL